MVFVCPVTKLLNMQVIEGKSTEAIMEGLTRLAWEVGFPFYMLADRESSVMKVFRDAQINLKDLQLTMYNEHGVRFQVAPVSGHNYHGLVERRIRTVQECFEKEDFLKNASMPQVSRHCVN
jgi:hypothetical protein